jgi:hypothetical protein
MGLYNLRLSKNLKFSDKSSTAEKNKFKNMTFYNIRAIEKNDSTFLWDSLYECIYVPVVESILQRDILKFP